MFSVNFTARTVLALALVARLINEGGKDLDTFQPALTTYYFSNSSKSTIFRY